MASLYISGAFSILFLSIWHLNGARIGVMLRYAVPSGSLSGPRVAARWVVRAAEKGRAALPIDPQRHRRTAVITREHRSEYVAATASSNQVGPNCRTVCSAVDGLLRSSRPVRVEPSGARRTVSCSPGLTVRLSQRNERHAGGEFFAVRLVILYTFPPS